MDPIAIISLVERGLTIAMALYQAGKSAQPAIEALYKLVTKNKEEPVTEEDIAATEALLDKLIADFNKPLD